MEYSIINRKMVKSNKAIKIAQKTAKLRYGRTRVKGPKAIINKIIILQENPFISMVHNTNMQESFQIPTNLTAEILIEKIREGNLTGLSGNGFSTADKLKAFAKSNNKTKYLIVNSAECDPGLLHDEWLLEHRYEQVQKGIQILNSCFDFEKVIVAKKGKVLTKDDSVQMIQVPNRYPMGHERLLIKTILGLELEKEELPTQKGILVLNVQTVLAIVEIVCNGMGLKSRYLTVADIENGNAIVVEAKIGSAAKDVITKAIPNARNKNIYIGGGVMACHLLQSLEKVEARTNFIAYGEKPDYQAASKCKKCGACSSKCPMGIKVHKIIQGIEKGQISGFEEFHPEKCIGCSACTYVCHAGKNIQEAVARVNGRI